MQLPLVNLAVRQSSCFKSILAKTVQLEILTRNYAKPAGGIPSLGKKKLAKGAGPALTKKIVPAETDPQKLVSYVCGTCLDKEGEDVKIQDDSEYPEWLWTLRTGPPVPLSELDPNSKEYWVRVRKRAIEKQNKLIKIKKLN